MIEKEVVRLAADKIMKRTTEEEKKIMLKNMIDMGASYSSDPLIEEMFRRLTERKENDNS